MKLQVKNFRCFKKTNTIELNNINLFIGPNGSGKSSFLRILPLLKQSVRTQHTSPILWTYNNYLDFGNFKTTVFNNHQTMSFGITKKEKNPFYMYRIFYGKGKRKTKVYENHVNFTIARKNDYTEYVRSIQLKIADDNISFTTEKKGNIVSVKRIRINEHTFTFSDTRFVLRQLDNRILPLITNESKLKSPIRRFSMYGEITSNEILDMIISDLGHIEIKNRNRPVKDNSQKDTTIKDFISRTGNQNSESSKRRRIDMIEFLLDSDNINIDKITNSEKKMLTRYKILIFLNEYLSYANDLIVQIANSVTYLAPFRAQAERYYLVQDLIDNELDSRGFNIPSYLTIMKANNLKKFNRLNDWLSESFGFEIDLKNAGNHTQLRISENDNLSNIADTGFGYSQLLPLLVNLWEALDSKNEKILIIEQPELHLHPRLQAMFLDAIIKVTQSNQSIRVVIESHSETIINRVGQHVRKNPKVSKAVSIYITEKTENVNIRKTKFDENGLIQDWPVNFLSPGEFKYDN